MEAHTTSVQRLRAADSREITSYQSWLRQNGATEESDGRFLDHGPDLVSLPRPVRSVSEASRKAVGRFAGTFLTIGIGALLAFSIGGGRGSRA
jgi:hypothetical protein